MADNVDLPVDPGPVPVATDEVDTGGGAAHVQLVKLLDATEGGTARMLVHSDGGVRTGARVLPVGGSLTTGTATPYADGDVIGNGLLVQDVDAGLYRLARLALVSLTGVDLPPITVVLVPTATTGGWTPPAENAPFVFTFPGDVAEASVATVVDGSSLVDLPLSGGAVQVCTDERIVPITDNASSMTSGNLVDVAVVLVADGATSFDFATNGVGVAVTLVHVGDQ